MIHSQVVAGRALRIILAALGAAFCVASDSADVWAQRPPDTPSELPNPAVQNPLSVRFERLGIEDGMQQGSAQGLMQDSRGFIWIATQDGLHRYDGHEMKAYTSVPFDTTSLSSGYIWTMEESSNGDIWVATADAGLNRLDPATGTALHYRHDPDDPSSLASDLTADVLETSPGDVWVATRNGLDRMRADEPGRFEHYRHDPDDPSTITSNDVKFLSEDTDGYVWAGTENGSSRIDPRTGHVKRFLYTPGVEPDARIGISVYKPYHPPETPEIVWLPTEMGLVRLHEVTGEYERFLIEPSNGGESPRNKMLEISADPEDPAVLWAAGSAAGLVRFDTRTESFATYGHDPDDPSSLSDDQGTAILADRSGMMWVGTAHGLNRFNPGSIDFTHLRHDPEDPQTLTPGGVRSIYEDSSGSLWVGTSPGRGVSYLTRIDGRTGRSTRFRGGAPGGILRGSPSSITEDVQRNLWVSNSGGLNRIDAETRHVTTFKHRANTPDASYRNAMYAVAPMKSDSTRLWIGSHGGLDRFDPRTGQFTHVPFASNINKERVSVLTLYEDALGTLWVGTLTSGLLRLKEGEMRFVADYDAGDSTSLSNNIVGIIMERDREPGILWLGTQAGLNRLDTATGKITHYTQEDGLPNNVIYGILEDSRGTLWLSTNNGISNFDPETQKFRNYGLDDGLMALEYNGNSFAKGQGGIMYFGSMKGLTAFSPENLSTNAIPPQVAFTDFKLFNESIDVGPESPLKKSLAHIDEIVLRYDQNEVTFEYAALHFKNPEKNGYKYRLKGHDDGWIDAGNRRAATYTNLAPGMYTFQVEAVNSDGVWNEEGASVALRITPPWWRTTWAYVGFGLFLIGAVTGVDRGQRRRLARKEAERAEIREAQLLAEAQQRRRRDAERLSEIGKAITSTLSVRSVIDTVYEHVNALMDATVFGIGIYNAEGERLEFLNMKEKGETLPPFANDLGDVSRPAVWCFKNRKPFIVGDFATEYKEYLPGRKMPIQGEEPSSIIYLPLIHKEKAVGVITTQSFQKNAYTDYHVSVLQTLATYAAIALENADSYRRLSAALNDLKSTQERLVQQEKLASLGALTAGIAHEIKNPLNFVTNFAGLSRELADELRVEDDPEEVQAIIADLIRNTMKIEEHGKRADSIVRSMMEHARGGSGTKEKIDLNDLVEEHADLAYHGKRVQVADFEVEIERDLDAGVGEVEVAPQDFGRVVLNLIGNAFDAVREKAEQAGNHYRPHVAVTTRRANRHVEIRVADNGAGIPPTILERIFEPFFTTKPAGSGTGLGLSLAHDIVVQGHGGTLTVESEEGEGTTFVISVPADN